MKFFAILILVLIAVPILGLVTLYALSYPSFGQYPQAEYRQRFEQSPQYDKERGIFVNRRPRLLEEMRKKVMTAKGIYDFFTGGLDKAPLSHLPEVKPDMEEFLKPSLNLKVIWFGHSSFILNFDGKIILFDPVFSGSAAPVSFMIKRFQPAVLTLEELPKIDYIVISHDHYDHLDKKSIQFFQNKEAKFLTPLGVGSYLRGWGIEESRITEMDWWQNHKVEDLEFIATPAQHFSGRDGRHDNHTLWASWVIRNSQHNVYFSGDSGYDIHFQDIGERFGPFDIAFMETGQYNERWKEVHMLPSEAAQAYFDLRAKRFFPVHWGMFVLALHPWYDPIQTISQLAEDRQINLVSPKLGEMIVITDDYKSENWWNDLLPPKTR